MRKKIISGVLIVLGLALACIGIFPFLWMAISGFKAKTEVLATPFKFFPSEWKFENYKLLFTYQNLDYSNPDYYLFPQGSSFVGAIGLTLAVALTALVLSLFVNSSAAYVFARLEFPFKKIIWAVYAMTMFVPNIAILIPCFQVVSKLHMTNNVVALILPGVVYVWSIFFYRQFYLGMPTSLEDAARIDGCGRFKIYLDIFLPMSATPFVIMGISVFQGYWNSYLWPAMVVSDPALYQINQLVVYLKPDRAIPWHLLMAASTIVCIPLIILLLILQRYILQGIKITGVK